MTIKSRLKKLETNSPSSLPDLVLFKRIVSAKDGREYGPSKIKLATIIGTNLGTFTRDEDESELDFKRRVYAAKAIGKVVEDMTNEELTKAYAIADREVRSESNDD